MSRALIKTTYRAGGVALLLALAAIAITLRDSSTNANPLTAVVDVSAGGTHTCALTSDGDVLCWGDIAGTLFETLAPATIDGLPEVSLEVVTGDGHACALGSDGRVYCWGHQFGNATIQLPDQPPDPVTIRASGETVCIVASSGNVSCLYQESLRTTELESVVDLAVGGNHRCIVNQRGGVECWGGNEFGVLGDGSGTDFRREPVQVQGLTEGVRAVAAGFIHTCALTAEGGVECWGANNLGQIGDGTTTVRRTPVAVIGLPGAVELLAAGGLTTCAFSMGEVYCWGGAYGAVPSPIDGLTGDVTVLTAGVDHGCALLVEGSVMCWGRNGAGQLGDGTTERADAAVTVVELQVKPEPTPTPCGAAGCPTPQPQLSCAAEACLALTIIDQDREVVCHASFDDLCSMPAGQEFGLAVEVIAAPANGYVLAQTYIVFGEYQRQRSEDGAGPGTCGDGVDNSVSSNNVRGDGKDRLDPDCVVEDLVYLPAPAVADEFTWPDLGWALRTIWPGVLLHGGTTALLPPLPVSHYLGPLIELAMRCSPTDSITHLLLVQEGQAELAPTSGALFIEVKPETRRQIIPEVYDFAVACCDPKLSAGDAAMILQLEAGLILELPCQLEADMNLDGLIDARDALLTLQLVAGLLPS